MNVEVYSAFMAIGISEERAKAALKALDEEIMQKLDYNSGLLRAEMAIINAEISKIQGGIASIRWFIGATALMLSIVLSIIVPLMVHFLSQTIAS